MSLKEKLQKAWENREQIAEGFYNAYLSHDQEIKEEGARRYSICEANTCGLWDSTGTSGKVAIPGQSGCTLCGCNGRLKTSCMQCQCALGDTDPATGQPYGIPLWLAVSTPDQEKEVNAIKYVRQFDKK